MNKSLVTIIALACTVSALLAFVAGVGTGAYFGKLSESKLNESVDSIVKAAGSFNENEDMRNISYRISLVEVINAKDEIGLSEIKNSIEDQLLHDRVSLERKINNHPSPQDIDTAKHLIKKIETLK